MTVKIFIKLAFRNILRNKRRTLIAGTAIGIGLACLIFADAYMLGMEKNMIRSATASFLGEGQIHHAGFRETLEVEKTIVGLDEITERLEQEPSVEQFAQRILTMSMISSPANVQSATMVGVDPSSEVYLSQIDEALIEGEYFQGDSPRDILIGFKLAEILEVELGDRVVLTAAQAHSGDLAQELFRISGIFRFHVNEMDRGMVFIRLPKAQEMLALDRSVHEIAIKFNDPGIGRDRSDSIWAAYSSDENEAVGWVELLPQMEAVFELSKFSMVVMGLIIFAVVALGIINTLFMSLYERMYEFGVLRAIGTRPFNLGRLVVFEACALALISIALGLVIGSVVSYIFTIRGWDLTGIEFSGVTFREPLYAIMRLEQYIIYPIWVFIITTLISLYPATFAAKLTPAKAMRKSF